MKKIYALVIIVLVHVIAACHTAENPLMTVEQDNLVLSLVEAAHQAEIRLRLTKYAAGRSYQSCMNQQENKQLCKKIYNQIYLILKSKIAFQQIKRADISDPQLWRKIALRYKGAAFMHVHR